MSELKAAEFERDFRALLAQLEPAANQSCVECIRCSGSAGCTFCRDSERLIRCNYCVRCVLCNDSSHCQGSRNLTHCSHCIDSESCIDSSYLIRCVGMTECSYCFGCVGLTRVDFHILNQRYERAEYFALTKQLSRELKLPR